MDPIYEKICEKLGCEPKDIKYPHFDTEDDRPFYDPLSLLTSEEIDYLIDNREKYFNLKHRSQE